MGFFDEGEYIPYGQINDFLKMEETQIPVQTQEYILCIKKEWLRE
jgi:hypothetical protein